VRLPTFLSSRGCSRDTTGWYWWLSRQGLTRLMHTIVVKCLSSGFSSGSSESLQSIQGAVLHRTCEAMFHECCDLCSPVWVVVPEGSKEMSNDGVAL
jgi:hypothetical protein